MNMTSALTLEEAKIKASILLKTIRSGTSQEVLVAIERVKAQGILTELDDEALLKSIKLKHTLEVIAKEHGFATWVDLKQTLEIPPTHDFVEYYSNGFLNHWFADYAQAKEYLIANGGYLLPYKSQFFICETDFISFIEMDPSDRDWQAIGYDWFKPTNKKAWLRLRKKLQKTTPK